jgi:hypothetical protein
MGGCETKCVSRLTRIGVIQGRPVPQARPRNFRLVAGSVKYFAARHHEPDPMANPRVRRENLTVEVEKHIEGRIVWLRCEMGLSS